MNATRRAPALPDAPAQEPGVLHDPFLREKLVLIGLVLASLPLGLVLHGAPSRAEAALFSAALMPLAAALVAARAGRPVLASLVAAAGEVAIALLVAATVGAAPALAWLAVATVETALLGNRRVLILVVQAMVPACAAVLALDGVAAAGVHPAASTVAATCALVVTGLAVARLAAPSRPRRRPDDDRRRDALVAAMGDAVVVFEADGTVREVLNGCSTLLDADDDTLAGRGFFDLVNVGDRPAFLKLLGDADHSNGAARGTLRMRAAAAQPTAGGWAEPRNVLVEIRARRAGHEVVAVLRDVTEASRREAEVEEAQRSVDAALRAKDHFLANMSHELRTPLNAIIGFSEILGSRTMSPVDPAKQREYAGIIHQSGQHLLSVVNAILDMSKIQSGTFSLLPEPFALESLVEQCCDVVRLQAQNGRVDIVRDVPDALEEIVADRRACRQILINLLSNAVKFTPERGRVTVTVRPEGTAMRIVVADTGIGIGEADLARLGDPFFQARSSLSRPYEGTGLGLSVVRGLVGLHGGAISIESEPGTGTSVAVRLPLDCRLAATSADTTAIEAIPRRASPEPVRPFETRSSAVPRSSDTRMKQSA